MSFLKQGSLPEDKGEAEKVCRAAPRYWLSKEQKLYKRSYSGPYLLCVHPLKIEEPLKAQEFKQSLKIYEEETFMCIVPLVKEKCMNMVIKMSLRYWSIGRSPLMKMLFHNNTLWARCLRGEGNVRNAISIWIIIVVLRFSYLVSCNSKHVNHI